VATVERYFERFLESFPTPAALAAAPEAELLSLWSGLGYYRRARQLRAAAQAITNHGGEIPRTARELTRLPGVGIYTAAAIASIAFGEPVAVVDGNVARVLSRRLARSLDATRPADRRVLATAAAEILDPERAGDSNQALMELGAVVCRPRTPRCELCPIAEDCGARAAGAASRIPSPRRRAASRKLGRIAALVDSGRGELLLVRRGDHEAQLAGLWEVPSVDARGARGAERALARRYGGAWRLDDEAARVRHAITVMRIELVAHRAVWRAEDVAERGDAAWVRPEAALAGWPLTAATRKLLARLAAP